MSSEGPKMGGGRYGSALEWPENGVIRRPKLAVATAFAGPIREHPGVVGREILPKRSPGVVAPTWVARASRGWPETSPTTKTCFA